MGFWGFGVLDEFNEKDTAICFQHFLTFSDEIWMKLGHSLIIEFGFLRLHLTFWKAIIGPDYSLKC